jgi:hypothetical protein
MTPKCTRNGLQRARNTPRRRAAWHWKALVKGFPTTHVKPLCPNCVQRGSDASKWASGGQEQRTWRWRPRDAARPNGPARARGRRNQGEDLGSTTSGLLLLAIRCIDECKSGSWTPNRTRFGRCFDPQVALGLPTGRVLDAVSTPGRVSDVQSPSCARPSICVLDVLDASRTRPENELKRYGIWTRPGRVLDAFSLWAFT